MIGIEADDDIAIAVQNGVIAREQLKHSVAGKAPFGNRSNDLWKTLLIWLDAAKNGDFNPETCLLLATSNIPLGDCFLSRLVACKGGQRKMQKCVEQLLTPSDPFPESIQPFVDRFKAHDKSLILRVLRRIDALCGEEQGGDKLRKNIASLLHLPADISADDILDGLLGWIHSTVMEAWRSRRHAWIRREAFDNVLHRLIRKARIYNRLGLAEHLINVPKGERERHLNKMFVRQLRLVRAADIEVLSAIDDFYRCSLERFRLASEGDVTADDWIDFDTRLTGHWQIVAGRERRAIPGRDPVEVGYATFTMAIQYETELAHSPTQPYLAKGTFHRLSNDVKIGWHPDYENLCKD